MQDIAIGQHEVGAFAGLDTAQLIGHAKDLGGIKRNGFEALFRRQSVRDGHCCLVGQITGIGRTGGPDAELDAGLMQLGRAGKWGIVRVVRLLRHGHERTDDHGDFAFLKFAGHFPGFDAAAQDHFDLQFVGQLESFLDLGLAVGLDNNGFSAARIGDKCFKPRIHGPIGALLFGIIIGKCLGKEFLESTNLFVTLFLGNGPAH